MLDSAHGVPASLADAKTKGIPVIAYGQLLNDIIGFLIVALAVFVLVKQVNRIKSSVDRADGRSVGVHEGVPVLRLDDFDQGEALPAVHVATPVVRGPRTYFNPLTR